MKKIKSILTLTFVAVNLFSCGKFEPNVEFIKPIKGRTVNLSKKVGNSLQVIRENDTIEYSLHFDKSTGYNSIVKPDRDTVFKGTITKRNELFLLNRPLNNGKFAIHALKFTDSTVTGLETEWLQSKIIKKELDQGKFVNLIIDTNGVKTLRVNKNEGKEMFRLVIGQLEPEKLVNSEHNYLTNEIGKDTDSKNPEIQTDNKDKLIKKVYPNPFTNKITIELLKKAPYEFKLFDLKGKLIKTSKMNTDNMIMELPNLKPGYYILKILRVNTEIIDEIKLIKK